MTSTEITATGGTELTRFNAVRHGVLSRHTVLPWEDPEEYRFLLEAMVAEHSPQGPTEEHLVEELTGVLWRKRRLRLAEAASFHRGLRDAAQSFRHTEEVALAYRTTGKHKEDVAVAIRATPEETQADLDDITEDETMTRSARDILSKGGEDSYGAAMAALRQDTLGWWQETIETPPAHREYQDRDLVADAASLLSFLDRSVMPWLNKRRQALKSRAPISEQALAEAFDVHKLDRLGRYEVHLDRKLERTLSMLVRLQELRAGPAEAPET